MTTPKGSEQKACKMCRYFMPKAEDVGICSVLSEWGGLSQIHVTQFVFANDVACDDFRPEKADL